jgi:hypothetical protein
MVRSSVVRCSVIFTVLTPLAAFAQGTIEGTVTFWGDPGGGTQIQVAAMPEPWTDPVDQVVVGLDDPFVLSVPDGSYYVWAYLDRDVGFGDPEPEDVVVLWDGDGDGSWDPVTVSGGSATGVDIDLGFVYVDTSANGANDGSSWADAFIDLQDGIDLAVSGVEVWVAEGTYFPGPNRSDSFLPKPGVRVCGGFVGTEIIRHQRDWNAHPTILSGEIGGASNTDNCYHVILADYANPSAIFDGFTVTRGYADGPHAQYDDEGGGVRARGGGVTLMNSTILDNYSAQVGGGITTYTPGYVVVVNSSFIGNEATYYGGGIWIHAAAPVPSQVVNCVFTGNSSFRGAALTVQGQVWAPGSEPVITNASVSNNNALIEAGGIYTNTTTANPPDAPVRIENSIVWGNTAPAFPQISYYTAASLSPVVNYGIVEGGWTGPGANVLDQDPSFADTALRLNLDSPAIDAGDNTAVPIDLYDADGNHWTDEPIKRDRDFVRRFRNLPYAPNTGVSAPGEPPVDMGAYEAWDPTLIFEHDFEGGDLDPWTNVVGGI